MTGYHPDFKFLKECGVSVHDDTDKMPIYNSETFETNVKGIYLAGVVCSGIDTSKLFIENTRYHSVNIIKNIKSCN